jgi:3-deoxy-D-manno-octulosonic-acid transferase
VKFLYRCLTYIYVLPLSLAVMIARIFGNRSQIERLGLGLTATKSGRRLLWLVASSVGEVTIAVKLIKRLKEVADLPVLLTVTTKTGRHYALQSGIRRRVPISLWIFRSTCGVSAKYNPSKIILLETELWPSLMAEAFARGIKIMQISGRLSEKSLRRYRPFVQLFRPLLERCDAFIMQSEEDAARLRELAGEDARIEVVGSLKGEYVPPAPVDLQKTREYFNPGKHKIVAWFDPPRRERYCWTLSLCSQNPDIRLVLAPRHLEEQMKSLRCKHSGRSYTRYSVNLEGDSGVYRFDWSAQPVLSLLFRRFVGGTLVQPSGHNLLDLHSQAVPCCWPYYENQRADTICLPSTRWGFH